MTDVPFKDYLHEYADIKGLSVKKLSDATNIPERYLEALLENNADGLPPAPYIRGYIIKLAETLDFDAEEMWRLYKKDNNINGSGQSDRLPSNRYTVKTMNKKSLIGGAAILLTLVYLLLNFNRLVGAPSLEIIYPAADNLLVRQPIISIEGRTSAGAKITIDDGEVFVDRDGRFQKEYPLAAGLNVISVVSKKFLGQSASVDKKVIYEPLPPPTESPEAAEPAIDNKQ